MPTPSSHSLRLLVSCMLLAILAPGPVEAQQFKIEIRNSHGHSLGTTVRPPQSGPLKLVVLTDVTPLNALPVQLISSHPAIFPVPASTQQGVLDVPVKFPSSPTMVTLTARLTTPVGALLEETFEFGVYPEQRITELAISPARQVYQQGERVDIQVRLAYPEPTDSLSLAMSRPRVDGTVYQDGLYGEPVTWRPGCGTLNLDLTPQCAYPVSPGMQSLVFPITIWGHPGDDPTTTWRISGSMLHEGQRQLVDSGMGPLLWTVQNIVPTVRAVRLERAVVTGGQSLTGWVELAHLATGQSVEVEMNSSRGVRVSPRTITAVGGASTFPFDVETDFVTMDQEASISARIGSGDAVVAALTVRSLLAGVDGIDRDLVAGEVRRITLRLRERAPQAIVVTLGSSDPRVTLPLSVTIQPGQQEVSIDLATAATISRQVPVTLTVRVGDQPERAFPARAVPVRR